jgi:hypothetical protein
VKWELPTPYNRKNTNTFEIFSHGWRALFFLHKEKKNRYALCTTIPVTETSKTLNRVIGQTAIEPVLRGEIFCQHQWPPISLRIKLWYALADYEEFIVIDQQFRRTICQSKKSQNRSGLPVELQTSV